MPDHSTLKPSTYALLTTCAATVLMAGIFFGVKSTVAAFGDAGADASGADAEVPSPVLAAAPGAVRSEADSVTRAAQGSAELLDLGGAVRPVAELAPLHPAMASPSVAADSEPTLAAVNLQLTPAQAEAPIPAPAAPVPTPKAAECVDVLKAVAERTPVYFGPASAELDQRGLEASFALASMARTCPEAQVTIVGYSDPSGDPAVNLALSWKRSNAVMDAIRSAGFDVTRFQTTSHLQDNPGPHRLYDVVDRRVEFTVRHVEPAQIRQHN